MSTYTAKITWKNDSPETFAKNRYTRGHTWSFDGGIEVPASSSPHSVRVPYSVEAAVDPEEALVASASSCHMLTFLWIAAKNGFQIDSYTDNAVGEMTKSEEGKEFISKITLDPQIAWSGEVLPTSQEIAEMHHEAHEGCYIANSIKAEVVVNNSE
ncbi:MAG TPA: OsmC family protein [Pyrinomonadaceae bacterium]|jgi:organic hydroperoxide reductase OsmC/OhrA|nr:OsmC family protein [Pyrinomonadaceae bacterium]